MKIYKQLQIPQDSAFDRKSIWKQLPPIWIKELFVGIKNLIKWTPIIWKDRDWDGGFIYEILQKKLEFQQKELVGANRHLGIWQVNRDITICLNLIERLQEDFYEVEYMDYHESTFNFIPAKDNEKYSELKTELISEKFDEYIYKNKLTYKKAVEYLEKNSKRFSVQISDKKLQCMTISSLKQKKAKKLLFNIIENRIDSWWD